MASGHHHSRRMDADDYDDYNDGDDRGRRHPVRRPAGRPRPSRDLDVHEMLKLEAFGPDRPGCDDVYNVGRPCQTVVGGTVGISDQYIVLDSFEKVAGSKVHQGELQFNMMVQGVTKDQTIGVRDCLDNVISVRVGAFTIPTLSYDVFVPATVLAIEPYLSVLTLVANGALPAAGDAVTNAQAQTPYGRVTLYLKEFGMQSYSDHNNRRHHFEFDASLVGLGDRMMLTPLRYGEPFVFTEPIQAVDALTACFYTPGTQLRLPPDCLYNVQASSNGAQLLTFTYTDPTNLLNLAVSDRVTIEGFVTGNTILDAYIARPAGHMVGAGGFSLGAVSRAGQTVTFRLNPDVTVSAYYGASVAVPSTSSVVVKVAINRIRIAMQLRRVVDHQTNFIAPGV